MKLQSYRTVVASIRPWAQLIKVPLCLPVACSAGLGFILHTPVLTLRLGLVICGVFFLACGAASLNSLQERSVDSLFIRTRHRPLVTGRITGREAMVVSAVLISLGLCSLFFGMDDQGPFLLGIAAIVLYNGVYTPLKGVSVFALFPGGLAGAIPPLIGWTTAGGLIGDSRAWGLFALFFLWQIPHFCLILLYYQQDYHTVNRPALIRLLPEQSLKYIVSVWILAFAAVALSLTLYRDLLVPGACLTIGLMACVTMFLCVPLVFLKRALNYRVLFIIFNALFFFAMLMVTVLQLLY